MATRKLKRPVSPADPHPFETFVLTGAASGIGRHLAHTFARQKKNLALTDVNVAGLKSLEKELRAAGVEGELLLRPLDVRQAKDWARLMDDVFKRFGRLDVLLNIAGYIRPGYVHEIEPDDAHRHFDINAKGVIFGTREAARLMTVQGRGHIINFASLAGVAPIPGIALYSASKHAVRGFSLAAAEELAPLGVHVTVICPDAVQTPMLDLQVNYREAALTFSGNRFLTVRDIERVVVDFVLPKRPREVLVPRHRGWLAKIGAAFPALARLLARSLHRKGSARQQQLRKN